MSVTPAATPACAARLPVRVEKNPSRNSPSVPPPKIPASVHQASSAPLTCVIAMAAPVPAAPQRTVTTRSSHIDWRSVARGLTKRR